VKKAEKIAEDSRIGKANELQGKVEEMQQKIKLKEQLKEKIKLGKDELQLESKNIRAQENKIKDLKNGKEHKEFINLSNKIDPLEQEIEEAKRQPLNSFSSINAALKKYERLTLEEKLVRKYLDSPLKALLEDKELKIVELIPKMKDAITKGSLELNKKKKDKILSELEKLSRTYFEVFLSKYNELNEKLNKLKSEIEKTKIVKEIEELEEKLNLYRIKVEEEELKVKELTNELEGINIDNLRKNLENNIMENIYKEVKIIF